MCNGAAIYRRDIPKRLIDQYRLRVIEPKEGEEDEPRVQFLFGDPVPYMPVRLDGEIDVVVWGNRNDKQSRLPRTGWCRIESLEAGKWKWLRPQSVVIPARFGLEKGVWFDIKGGFQGVIVRDEAKAMRVYVVTQPATDEYRTLTGHDRMPVFCPDEPSVTPPEPSTESPAPSPPVDDSV